MSIHWLKISSLLVCGYMLLGCSTTGSSHTGSSNASPTTFVRDVNGATQYRIREGNVFTPNGTRVARIDSRGNIYSTQGRTTGQRVGRIK
jgi:hypothetical protein